MINRIVPVALLSVAMIGLNACKNNSYQKTKNGLEYKIVKDAKSDKKTNVGDIVSMHVTVRYKDDKTDTILLQSRKINNNQPVEFMLGAPPFKGAWEEGIAMLTPGDSASFKVSIDSLQKAGGGEMPTFMKKGQKLEYDVVMVAVRSKDEVQKDQQAKAGQQKQIDDQKLQEYFSQNNIKAERTTSGLYYTIDKPGAGPNPSAGQSVTVNYTGKTLDGKPFDSNVDPQFQHTEPFEFKVGQGMVIPGWDEGVMLLNKGSKAKLYVPSTLAYGPQGAGPIAPNSILVFDIEVTNIK